MLMWPRGALSALLGVVLLGTAAGAPAQPLDPAPGRYTTTLAPRDAPLGLSGAWGLSLDADGRYTTSHVGVVVVEGRYTLQPDRLVFADERGARACQGATAEPGSYSWTLDAGQLVLAPIEDACPGRAAVLSSQPWARQD
jgi:hypothetical protein